MSHAPQRLPDGFAFLPPGPELAGVLASVDVSRLAPGEVFEVLAAQARMVAHYQAQLLSSLYEGGRVTYVPGAGPLDRKVDLDRFSADEASFTLRWSVQTTASYQFLAERLIRRLPAVYAALVAGRIDLPKAWAFHSALVQVNDEAAATIVDRLIERAGTSPLANLQNRLRYWVAKLDPDAARKRHDASVADRRVYARLDECGTAALGGSNLPPDRAGAAYDRLDALARAAKADGDPRTLNQLRADAMMDMLGGIVFTVRPSRDPVTSDADAAYPRPDDPADRRLIDHDRARATNDGADGGGDAQPAGGGEAEPPARPLADAEWLSWVGFTDAAGRPLTTAGHAWPDPTGGGYWQRRERHGGTTPAPVTVTLAPGVDPGFAAALSAGTLCGCGGLRPSVRGGVHLQVKLSTLMCLDSDPALVPGWGPVIADIARQVAAEQQARPPWYWDVTDERGNLLHHGHTRRRPTPTEAAFVKARDRTCRAPGCRRPALWCDLDHEKPYSAGAPSHRGALCSLCEHHHYLRHEHGYIWHRIHHGTYLVDSPSGRHYLVTPDAHLILTAEDLPPRPPPADLAALFTQSHDNDDG